jgi:hypothetical protein
MRNINATHLFLIAMVLVSSSCFFGSSNSDVNDLSARFTGKTRPSDILRVVLEFAHENRPKAGFAEFLSDDGQVYVVIGADGDPFNLNGTDVVLNTKGTKYNIAVAGNGITTKTGDGSNGGNVVLKGDTEETIIIIAGHGGKGADNDKGKGGSGGQGGLIDCQGHYAGVAHLWPGDGGSGGTGRPGGNGGPGGGCAGPEGCPGKDSIFTLRGQPAK